ncbi:ABC-type sugar transport system substrate-binding protein [Marmoricola sp. URHA0025 HA25]
MQFVNPLPDYPQWSKFNDCMAAEAKRQGVEYAESGPTSPADATEMSQQVQQAISSKKDIIVTYPASDGFAALLKQAQNAGIVTGTAYGTGGPDTGADFNAGFDWKALGKLYADAVAARGGKQVVGLVAVSDTGQGKLWLDGFKEEAKTAGNVSVAGEVFTNDDSAKALDQVNALLTAHPDINVIASHMGTTTQSAVAAIKSRGGKSSGIVFIGNGPDNGGKEALASGASAGQLLQNFCQEGEDIVKTAISWAKDGKGKSGITVQTKIANDDELKSLQAEGWG